MTLHFMKLLTTTLAATVALSGCGGGGGDSIDSGLFSNRVTVSQNVARAGDNVPISAIASVRGATPVAMTWRATPLTQGATNGESLVILDADCGSASYVPPAKQGLTGQGQCDTVLILPAGMTNGRWRLTNTVKTSDNSTFTGFAEIEVLALPDNGFRLIEPTTPLSGYVNRAVTLNVPFTANPGARVENVKYEWSGSSQNPSAVTIAGQRTSTATVVPTEPGQYQFDVRVTATVNNVNIERTASVVVIVEASPAEDIVSAGPIQSVRPGQIVQLNGSVLIHNPTQATYTYTWNQLGGAAGGPAPITFANRDTASPSFVAPNIPGTYGVEMVATRHNASGSTIVKRAQTYIIVTGSGQPFFDISVSGVQIAQVGSPVTLTANATGGNSNDGTRYTYRWSQVGSTPAAVTLSGANTKTASFIPTAAGTYTFEVEVTATNANGATLTLTERVQVIVNASSSSSSTLALTANAGNAQAAAPNNVVTLNGSHTAAGATSGVTYTYSWTQVGSTPVAVTLSNANSPTASFVPTTPGTYTFELTVTATKPDGSTQTASSQTQVVVGAGKTFTVSAGDAQVVNVNSAATLNGAVTYQGTYTGHTVSYSWTQVGTSPAVVTISNADSATASFIPQTPGLYTFELSVTVVDGSVTQTRTATTQVLAQ